MDLPLIADVDLLIVGGAAGGVAAALAARAAGRSVLIAAPRPYLGDDICAYARYWCEPGAAVHPLAQAIFPGGAIRSPLHVKSTLEQACVDAGIDLIFGAYPAGVLRDAGGGLCGLAVATRGGRFAVRAAAVIDATHRGLAARQAGAACLPWPQEPVAFRRVVIGAPAIAPTDAAVHPLGSLPIPVEGKVVDSACVAYEIPLPCDGSVGSLQAAEVAMRRRTWHHQQMAASEACWFLVPDPLAGGADAAWTGAESFPLAALAAAPGRLWVLGGAAAVPRATAARLVDPTALIAVGDRLGRLAAGAAPAGVPVRAELPGSGPLGGELRMANEGLRPFDRAAARIPGGDGLPELAAVDVLVCGGGTGGAPAATGAARQGARTLLTEHLHALGGVGTLGQITRYWYGNRVGYTSQLDDRTVGMGPAPRYAAQGRERDWFQGEWKQQAHLLQVADAGGAVWFGAIACAALRSGDRVTGAMICHEHGCGLVRSAVLIDGSGNADLAAAAGAETVQTGAEHVAVQGTGLSPVRPGVDYTNSDHTFVDDGDARDVTRAHITARRKFADAWDLAQLIGTRQRRQIVGDYALTPLDILCDRAFPDAICRASSNFDTHGFTIHPIFTVLTPTVKERLWAWVPYRCLLPRGLDGLLVTGLGMSAHRDALPVVRMQPDVQNAGYAAGVAAALAVRRGAGLRAIDLAEVQRHLVATGNLPAAALGMRDGFPLPAAEIAAAAQALGTLRGIAACFAYPAEARPHLIAALDDPARREPAAMILGLLGDAAAAPTLRELLDAADWDAGWNFKGMHQSGASQSRVDALVMALGACGDAGDPARIARLADRLGERAELSHIRAVADACAGLHRHDRAGRGAACLERLLALPGMAGHACADIALLQARQSADINDNEERNLVLRELHLAVALVRCGDPRGIGRGILRRYADDLRGHFARHARAVLAAAPAAAAAG